jgi:hypothetical protein
MMDVTINRPPRSFRPTAAGDLEIHDCGAIHLAPDEQVTFRTEGGAEYDVVRKSWGFYATPSLNGRLPAHGLRPALIRNAEGRDYVVLVEGGHENDFRDYLAGEGLRVVTWLDEGRKFRHPESTTL